MGFEKYSNERVEITMNVKRLDHFVLTVKNLSATCNFYKNVLGMEEVTFNNGRRALQFGEQKINLHELCSEFGPKAAMPTPGAADLCFITEDPLEDVLMHLKECSIQLIEGPVERTGALGNILSVYISDPDGNLIEISNYK
jgi:catechol 2,3-dioxygenase-like lactoylglutathione lyase family enzyme